MNKIFILILLTNTAHAADIQLKNRVQNDPIGVCWWTCADMIGREKEINRLIGLKEKIIHHGYGAAGGATKESIEYWIGKLQLKTRQTHVKNEKFLTQNIDNNLPIIVNMILWDNTKYHAILLLEVTRKKKNWADGNLKIHHDYIVTYIDPNNSQQKRTQTWTVFWKNWSGTAYTFDPDENK